MQAEFTAATHDNITKLLLLLTEIPVAEDILQNNIGRKRTCKQYDVFITAENQTTIRHFNRTMQCTENCKTDNSLC
jgi:hypothetical protein